MIILGPVTVRKTLSQAGEEHEVRFTLQPPDGSFRAEIARLLDGGEGAPPVETVFSPERLAGLLLSWEGLADAGGVPLPCTPAVVSEVCDLFPAVHAALVEAVFEAVPQQVRKNFRPSPAGLPTGEGTKPAGPAATPEVKAPSA